MLVRLRVLRHRPIQHTHAHAHTHTAHTLTCTCTSSTKRTATETSAKVHFDILEGFSRPEGPAAMLQEKRETLVYAVHTQRQYAAAQQSRMSQGLRTQPLGAMRCAFNPTLRKGFPQRSHTKQSSYTCWLVGVLRSTTVTVHMEEIGLPSSPVPPFKNTARAGEPHLAAGAQEDPLLPLCALRLAVPRAVCGRRTRRAGVDQPRAALAARRKN